MNPKVIGSYTFKLNHHVHALIPLLQQWDMTSGLWIDNTKFFDIADRKKESDDQKNTLVQLSEFMAYIYLSYMFIDLMKINYI